MEPGAGLLESLRGVANTLVGAVQARLQLAANELEEQGARIAQMALLWALAGFCLAIAVMLGAALLVVVFWDTHRVAVLVFLTTLFAIGGIVALVVARIISRNRPTAFAATLGELRADREALGGGPH